jgi:hypothetical protein
MKVALAFGCADAQGRAGTGAKFGTPQSQLQCARHDRRSWQPCTESFWWITGVQAHRTPSKRVK